MGFLGGKPWFRNTVAMNAKLWIKRIPRPQYRSGRRLYDRALFRMIPRMPLVKKSSSNEKPMSGPTTILGSFFPLYQNAYILPSFLGVLFASYA